MVCRRGLKRVLLLRWSKMKVRLEFEHVHLFLKWPCSIMLFSQIELIKLHRMFSHPSATKLANLVKRAHPEKDTNKILKRLADVVPPCDSCQRMAPKPSVFQVTLPDETVFSREAMPDLTYTEPRPHPPVLYILDKAHFSAARFPKTLSSESFCVAFIARWLSIYIGFSYILASDQRSLLTCEMLKNACTSFGYIQKYARSSLRTH